MTKLAVHYDEASNAAYIRFSPETVIESEEVAPDLVLDFDAEGRIVGIEVLDAGRLLSPTVLGQAA